MTQSQIFEYQVSYLPLHTQKDMENPAEITYSIDWLKGKVTGTPILFNGENHAFL